MRRRNKTRKEKKKNGLSLFAAALGTQLQLHYYSPARRFFFFFLARPRLDVGKNMGSSAFPVRIN
jgi:hypothetical protein